MGSVYVAIFYIGFSRELQAIVMADIIQRVIDASARGDLYAALGVAPLPQQGDSAVDALRPALLSRICPLLLSSLLMFPCHWLAIPTSANMKKQLMHKQQ
jgi:hypothetical protein